MLHKTISLLKGYMYVVTKISDLVGYLSGLLPLYNRLQAETNDSRKPVYISSTLFITTQRGRYTNRTLRNKL
ncbi:hypothetical protein A6J66_005245 [Yersinia enterocolitica]|nr:hypothetical protein A6J66_005245 [Yersinia enterocolitica]